VRSSGPQSPLIIVRITIRGVSRETPVSADVQFKETSLTASGEFDILQSDFGITPFSTAFGALRIDDRLHVKFMITAERSRQISSREPESDAALVSRKTDTFGLFVNAAPIGSLLASASRYAWKS
jgi:hypothetical protein